VSTACAGIAPSFFIPLRHGVVFEGTGQGSTTQHCALLYTVYSPLAIYTSWLTRQVAGQQPSAGRASHCNVPSRSLLHRAARLYIAAYAGCRSLSRDGGYPPRSEARELPAAGPLRCVRLLMRLVDAAGPQSCTHRLHGNRTGIMPKNHQNTGHASELACNRRQDIKHPKVCVLCRGDHTEGHRLRLVCVFQGRRAVQRHCRICLLRGARGMPHPARLSCSQ
jgi:hypothetical protein